MSEYFSKIPVDDRFASGYWGTAEWELFETQEMPPLDLCTTAAVVAITDIKRGEIVLTENNSEVPSRKGKLELPGGHLERCNPEDPESLKEYPEEAACRESLEEAGFVVAKAGLFACRRILNPESSHNSTYPPEAYSPYFWGITDQPLGEPTDNPPPTVRTFLLRTLQDQVRLGKLDSTEFAIINRGVLAARRDLPGGRGK